jgi:hypothetical protein
VCWLVERGAKKRVVVGIDVDGGNCVLACSCDRHCETACACVHCIAVNVSEGKEPFLIEQQHFQFTLAYMSGVPAIVERYADI